MRIDRADLERWLRARCTDLTDRLAAATAALDELRLEVTVLEARACATVPADGVDET